jgi:MFS family permease
MFSAFLSYSTSQVFLKHAICQQTPNCTSLVSHSDQGQNVTLSPAQGSALGLSSCGEELHDIEQRVQSEASHWLLYLNIASGVPSILVSLFYGGLSDLLGRKLFIILPVVGTAFNAATVLAVIYFGSILPLSFLLLGSLVAGLLGNFSVVNFAVYSYASDVSSDSKRTRQIGILESMTYLGGTLSLVLGGLWITKANSFAPPLWCVIACNAAVLVYVITALPESWSLKSGRVSGHSRLSSLFKSIGRNLIGYFILLFTSWRLAVLMLMFFVVEINFLGIIDVVILYSLGEPLCWSPDFIGYFLALKVFLSGLGSLLLLPLLSAIGLPDTIIIMFGLASGSAALVIMGLATHTWMMFIGSW